MLFITFIKNQFPKLIFILITVMTYYYFKDFTSFIRYGSIFLFQSVFKLVECDGSDSINLPKTDEVLVTDTVLNRFPTEIKVSVESDTLSTVSTGLSTLGKALESYQPSLGKAAIITAVGVGGAKILKTLPGPQRFLGILTLSGFTLAGSMFSESASSNQMNSSLSKSSEEGSSRDFPISSSLEGNYLGLKYTYPEELLMMSVLLITILIFYLMLSMILSYTIKLFEVESKEFVTKRPKLHKWILFFNKGREFNNFFLLNLGGIGFYQIIYELMTLLKHNRFTLKTPSLSQEHAKEFRVFMDFIFDFFNSEKGLVFILLFITLMCSYVMTTVLIGEYFRIFQIESKEFVVKRPKLHKWILSITKDKISTIRMLKLFFYICLCLGLMFYHELILLILIQNRSV